MKQYEKLLYQANVVPSRLVMVFLLFNIWQTIFTLNGVDIAATGIRTAEIILLNIFISFLVFVASAEVKRYNLRWSYIGLGTGIFQCLRIFFIPASIEGGVRTNITLSLLIAGLLLIVASIWSVVNSKRYILAKKE
jgi:phosphatidylglycerophosphate synthase